MDKWVKKEDQPFVTLIYQVYKLNAPIADTITAFKISAIFLLFDNFFGIVDMNIGSLYEMSKCSNAIVLS